MLLNNQDSDPTWIIEDFEYHEDPLAPGSLFGVLTATTARVNVMYKDVDVLQLPDGSWFMVMVRLRWRAPPETELTPPDSCPPGPGAAAVPPFSEQLCDIVGWWSPDASFATGQERGPFLVVDSLDALPNLDARFWLGVPGAVIATSEGRQSLYVYYMLLSHPDPAHMT